VRRPHPAGYPIAEDSPAFVAPALELRRAVEAVKSGDVEDAVQFTLTFPVVERSRDSETTSEEGASHPLGDEPDTFQDLPAIDSESTVERDPYRDGEVTLQASERDVLLRLLQSIGALDEQPDLRTDRPSTLRVLLARARATRFRVALLDAWPEDFSSPRPVEELLELALHPAAIVVTADGFASDPATGVGADDEAVVATIVDDVRERMPEINRATLREAGAAAFARVTLLGTKRAAEYLRGRFSDLPGAERRAALAVAETLATNEDRLIAYRMLEAALR